MSELDGDKPFDERSMIDDEVDVSERAPARAGH
jgi:hypothetical protein